MFNIGIGVARFDTIESAFTILNEVGNNEQLIKKYQYDTVLKQKKKKQKTEN